MEDLIPVINKLSDVMTSTGAGAHLELDLPQIVVIGSQSSGKSSVLESLVGRGFLPRGSGIVTRRPLVLQLVHTSGSEPDYAQFLHRPGQRFTDFQEVEREIVRDTERVTGKDKGVSRVPINLKVFSKDVVDLTLVDLPGITRVPLPGQPDNIEELIRAMCLEYITQPNSIILAVTPGNVDLSTSDAIQLARRVDPAGMRTLGVITKLDLMDRGTDAYDVLTGSTIPLRLGYVGVVCRSQRDIDAHKSMADALADERRFFQTHPRYSRIADRCGTQYLAKTLNAVLLRHIQAALPALRQRVTTMLGNARLEVAKYSSPLADCTTPDARGAVLLQLLNRFSDEFKEALEGRTDNNQGGTSGSGSGSGTSSGSGNSSSNNGSDTAVFGGAKLRQVFEDQFGRTVAELKTFTGVDDDDIAMLIKNSAGVRNPLFVPENAFETLARRQISLLEEPALECADQVYDELRRLFEALEERAFAQYHNLSDAVAESVNTLLATNHGPTREMIRDLVQIELAHINVAHPDFIGGDRAMQLVLQRFRTNTLSSRPLHAPSSPSSLSPAQSPQQRSRAAGEAPAPPRRPRQERTMQAKCFICGETIQGDNAAVNAHIDACLAKSNKEEKAKKKSGWSWFRSDESDKPAPPTPRAQPQPQQKPAPAAPPKPAVSALDDFDDFMDGDTRTSAPQPAAASPAAAAAAATAPGAAGGDAGDDQDSLVNVFAAGYARDPRFGVELVRVLLESYFAVVKKNIRDSVPKAIMFFLVARTAEDLNNHLVQTLYRSENFEKLLEEAPEIVERRAAARQNLEVLKRAAQILADIRDAGATFH